MTIYHVFANRSNIGDWLSARGIQSLLAPQQVTELLCDEPFVPETLDRLGCAGPDDLVVIGGGGLFMDYFEPFWQGVAKLTSQVPIYLWGVGCCDMKRVNSLLSESLAGSIAARARVCVVRDELTRAYLSRHAEALVVPCPTVNVVGPRPPGWGVLHVDAYDNVGEDVYQSMNRQCEDYAAHTGRPFRAINNLIPAGSEQALSTALSQYAAADLIVTGRLHGCIVGLAMGRRVLAVSGDHKVESFMTAAGLSDWVLGLEQIGTLPAHLATLSTQPTPSDFLDHARHNNCLVAAQIQSLTAPARRG